MKVGGERARGTGSRKCSTRAARRRLWLAAVRLGVVLSVWFGLCLASATSSAQAAPAKAAPPPVNVAILLSSRTDRCHDAGDIDAIRRLTALEADRINGSAEMGGRKLRLEFLDDQRDATKTVANMRGILANPSTVAVLGLANSTTAKTLFDEVGKDIRQSGMPFISDLSVSNLFADYANVFSTRGSQDNANLPVLRRFLKDSGAQRPAFIGIKSALFSAAMGDGLKGGDDIPPLVADHRLTLTNDKLDPEQVTAAVRDLKEKNVDFLFVSIGASRTAPLLRQMMASGVRPPVFVSGRIDTILNAAPDFSYSNDVHHLAYDGLPDAFNERLRLRIARSDPLSWQFEGKKVADAPGWRNGDCKPKPTEDKPDILRAANLRAIGVGTQYGDMVSLIAEAIKAAPDGVDIPKLRRHITEQLQTAYADGHGTFRGNFENWSFSPTTRAASRTPLIVTLKAGTAEQRQLQLAPVQYVRLRNDVLRPVQTLYLDIDMIRTFRVDDNEKSFFADFYLSMHHDEHTNLDRIEFANAFLDPQTNNRQISVRPLHTGGQSITYPADMKVYRVSGKFMYEPRLSNYPFDVQRFAIDLQPKLGDAPFIIQPPPNRLRDQAIDADGWDKVDQYVGYNEDFIRLIDAKSYDQSVVPFYKGSFVWVMRRQATDYYQRVVVPLGFILVVAYLSIFIPRTHFEAVVTIQVTALLSAVALYLALPKVDADTATFSDRIFLFCYLSVSVMIAISIARISPFLTGKVVPHTLAMLHIIGIPVMVAAMAFIVGSAMLTDGHSWTAAWTAMFGGT